MPRPNTMTGAEKRSGLAPRTVAALYGLALLLAVTGAAAVLLAVREGIAIEPAFELPWLALFPVFVAGYHFSIDFEYRKQARSLTFTQLPLALGVVFTEPLPLVATWVAAICFDTLLLRRPPAVKLAFNVGVGLCEVGALLLCVALLSNATPDYHLWIGLLVGLFAGELVGQLAMTLVMRMVGGHTTWQQAAEPLLIAAGSTLVFTLLAIVAVTSVWTEPLASLVILALAGVVTLAYRGHRRLSAQQRATTELYDFVKDLGPLDVRGPGLRDALEQVRLLLHTSTLDLAVLGEEGGWEHITVTDDTSAPASELDRIADQAVASGGARLRGADQDMSGRMFTPLFGSKGVLGILSALDRSGDVRDFDMGDLRLLETVATQLATAIERGGLLRDLELAATTDELTQLPNLNAVTRLIDALLVNHGGVLVAAVAVDSFREVNDTLGHLVGDELLVEVTRRLRLAAPSAVLGRIGGGRFAVAVPSYEYSGDPEMLGLGLRAQVEGGAQLGPVGTHIRLSVGCANGPEHGTDAENLIRRAETAMYSARHHHGGPVLWEPAYEVQGQRRLAVVMALREALTSGAIGLGFQPKVSAIDGRVTGVEALARWTHPALGAITPDEFIPLAEASGLMGPLTSTVLRQALTACKGWQRRAPGVGVAVNVSAETVLDPSFVTEVAAIVTATGLPSSLVTLELTEGVVVNDPEQAARRMQELRELGIKLSVDDFGTGYSSLTYLKGLPVDEVKIDKGFVNGLVDDPADRAVVRAVVDIAHTLGMRVVAEGVETEDQQRALRVLGVDDLQGYLFARPMPAVDMAAWLRRREASVSS